MEEQKLYECLGQALEVPDVVNQKLEQTYDKLTRRKGLEKPHGRPAVRTALIAAAAIAVLCVTATAAYYLVRQNVEVDMPQTVQGLVGQGQPSWERMEVYDEAGHLIYWPRRDMAQVDEGQAQALLGDPPILILDEPTVGLDPAQIVEIRDLIRELGQRHTVILSTHILPEAQLVCNRVVMIQNGRLAADGPAESLTGSPGRLCAEIRGAPEQVLSLLRAVRGVSDAWEDGEGRFLIQPEEGEDVREAVFYALAEARTPLVGLRDSQGTLEQAFLQIMTKGGSAEAGDADHD